MPLCVNSAAKTSDNLGVHIGEGTDDAPRIEPFKVSHGVFLLRVAGWCLSRLSDPDCLDLGGNGFFMGH